jgi:hypothetical protein
MNQSNKNRREVKNRVESGEGFGRPGEGDLGRRWLECEWWLINIVKCVECCGLLVSESVRSFISVFLSFTKQYHLYI